MFFFLSHFFTLREIALNLATAVVIASKDRRLALELAGLLSCDSFRCFVSDDVVSLLSTYYVMNQCSVGKRIEQL